MQNVSFQSSTKHAETSFGCCWNTAVHIHQLFSPFPSFAATAGLSTFNRQNEPITMSDCVKRRFWVTEGEAANSAAACCHTGNARMTACHTHITRNFHDFNCSVIRRLPWRGARQRATVKGSYWIFGVFRYVSARPDPIYLFLLTVSVSSSSLVLLLPEPVWLKYDGANEESCRVSSS